MLKLSAKDERKVKRTIYAGIGLILLAAGMFTILLLNSSVSSVASASSDASISTADTSKHDQTLNAVASDTKIKKLKSMTKAQINALQKAAAKRLKEARDAAIAEGLVTITAVPGPGDTPYYFGPYPNYATSTLPVIDPTTGAISGGIRKFIDSLPGLGPANASTLGQYLSVAVPDTTTYPGSDYYEIALVDYRQQMHRDLTATKLRGYVQLSTAVVPGSQIALTNPDGTPILKADGSQAFAVDNPRYLGPVIIAQKDRPVRVKFYNLLPTGAGGDLFIPVDPTVMGAGRFTIDDPLNPGNLISGTFTQNRATLHLHGGRTPWISDGTPHQWITPANETTPYPKGVSARNVPDMWYDANGNQVPAGTPGATNDPGDGSMTFFYTNNQSSRFMFYHDHSYGITRLNVYAGEAAGYLLRDTIEQGLISSGIIPADEIQLTIQDKTFVPDNTTPITNMWGTFPSQLKFQDPTWNTTKWGDTGDLWFPHVYMTLQNPYDVAGVSPFGRWMYAPWFWPPATVTYGPVANPYYDPLNPNDPMNPPMIPGTPNPSIVAEAFMDTPVVNGAAYPYLEVDPKAYRFRILNAADDRFWNLQLYQADGGGGTGVAATATLDPINGNITAITVTNAGTGYTFGPTVYIISVDGNGTGATATATIDATGAVTGVTVTNGGTGYTSAPLVLFGGATEVKMVPAVPPDACNPAAQAYPATWPTDSRPGGVPDPVTAGPQMIQIGNEAGFLPAPVELPNQPVDWNMDPGTFDMGIVNTYTLFLGPAQRADVIVDFSQYAGKTLILYNDAPAPVPANDPRLDYYTGDIDQTDTGGAPTTLPGYGPNTRTIMQIRVRNNPPAPVYNLQALKDAFNSTGSMATGDFVPGAFAASQNTIIVPQAGYDSAYNATFPVDPFARIQDTSITFTPIGSTTPVTLTMEPKALQDEMGEAFDKEYGRNGGMMGLEMPFTLPRPPQTFILYPYASPPTEVIKPSMSMTPIGTLGDGTQIWSITHNGVDTHPMHWHGFEVQLINRVAWDNNIRQPDLNELGWKETLTVNPLQNIIVALRPIAIDNLPFDVPNSIRPIDVTKPLGATLSPPPLGFQDPTLHPITILNNLVNFGWEYVWHCHILQHEEMDLMHGMTFAVAPKAPSDLTATNVIQTSGERRVRLSWTDNSANEINWIVQRSTNGIDWTTIKTVLSETGPATGVVRWSDKNVPLGTYYYRVLASNVVGDTTVYPAPAVGFPTMTLDSAPSNTATITVV